MGARIALKAKMCVAFRGRIRQLTTRDEKYRGESKSSRRDDWPGGHPVSYRLPKNFGT
jgi:hypothetical protein